MTWPLLLAAAVVLGRLPLRMLPQVRGIEHWVWRLTLGLILTSWIALLLGALHLLAAQTALALIAAAGLLVNRRGARAAFTPAPYPRRRPPAGFYLAVTAAALLLILLRTLLPVTSWEAAAGALAVAKEHALAAQITAAPLALQQEHRHFAQVLYSTAFYNGGTWPVLLTGWLFAVLAAGAGALLARCWLPRREAPAGAAIVATLPVLLHQGGAAGSFLPLALLHMLAICALLRSARSPRRWAAIGGFLAGTGVGFSAVGLLAAGMALLASPLLLRRKRIAAMGSFALGALAGAAPWVLWPLLEGDVPAFAAAISAPAAGWQPWLRFPWDILLRPSNFGGWAQAGGGLMVALFPALFMVRRRVAPLLALYCAAGLWISYWLMPGPLAVLPFVTLLAAVSTGALAAPRGARWLQAILIGGVCFGLVLQAAATVPLLWRGLLPGDRETYLRERAPNVQLFDAANQALSWEDPGGEAPARDVILSLDPRSYYLDARAFTGYAALSELEGAPPEVVRAWLTRRRIALVMLPALPREVSAGMRPLFRMVDSWSQPPHRHIRLVEQMVLPHPRGRGVLHGAVYEVIVETEEAD